MAKWGALNYAADEGKVVESAEILTADTAVPSATTWASNMAWPTKTKSNAKHCVRQKTTSADCLDHEGS